MKAKFEKVKKSQTIKNIKEVPTIFSEAQYDQTPNTIYQEMVLGNNLYAQPVTV